MTIYRTMTDLMDQEIVAALNGVNPAFDIAAFVDELLDTEMIVYRTFQGAAQYDGFELVTDEEGSTPGFWELVEKHDSINAVIVNRVLADLNAYTGDNIWQDVIYKIEPYLDDAAIDAADPSGRSDIIILTTGEKFQFIDSAGQWIVEQA